MTNKNLFTASLISLFSIILLSLIIPTVVLLSNTTTTYNFNLFLFLMFLLAISISVVFSTIIRLTKYSDNLDNIEQLEQQLYKKEQDLDILITKYKELILKDENSN